MFENLSERLEHSFKILKGEGKITEINVAETLKDVRRALLDADVNYKVAKSFTDTVKQKAMGMNVLAYNRHSEPGTTEGYVTFKRLDDIYSQSDVISLHCPLFPETREMINEDTISRMKDGVIIINNSRGLLIDEKALKRALDAGKVRAAAVDVVSSEPIKHDNPLLSAKNCIITPHISWAAKETRERLMGIAVDNVKAFLAGKPVNVVNM